METFMEILWLALYGIAGLIIHLCVKWQDARTKKIKFNWADNLAHSITGVIVLLVLLFFRDGLKDLYPVNKYTMFFSVYFADSAWKNITKFGAKQIKV